MLEWHAPTVVGAANITVPYFLSDMPQIICDNMWQIVHLYDECIRVMCGEIFYLGVFCFVLTIYFYLFLM